MLDVGGGKDYGGCNENNQAVLVIVTITMYECWVIHPILMDTLVRVVVKIPLVETLVVCMQ